MIYIELYASIYGTVDTVDDELYAIIYGTVDELYASIWNSRYSR